MPLSEKQLEDVYEASLKSSIDISHISKQLDKGDKTFGKHEERITQVEKKQSLLKGKIGAFVLFLTLCVTIMVYGVGWLLQTHNCKDNGRRKSFGDIRIYEDSITEGK